MRIKRLTTLLLEKICNGYLRLDAESQRYLSPLQGKVVHILLPDWRWQSYWLFAADRVRILSEYEGVVDTAIKGSFSDFLNSAHASINNTSSFSAIEIQGNMEVAQQLQTLLRRIEIDWEELLSHFTGDIVAHQLGKQTRRTLTWGRATVHSLRQNMTEYLQEELRYFPSSEEVADFCEEVTLLRHDVERLLARSKLLIERTKTQNS